MKPLDPFTITEAVLESMDRSPDARLRSVMGSLVRHLHDFAREVKLTEDEWWRGIRFLTDAGHITDDKRQEFILLSDVLGLSTLVMAQNNTKPAGCTEATVFGPFFVEGAPMVEHGADIANGAKGAPCFVRGRVTGLDGEPIANALVDVWQADEEGFYDVQKPDPSLSEHRARAQLRTDADGRYHFRSIVAHEYPIPHDGPVGALLDSLGRHPWRPAHLHFMIQAQGYERLITHVFRRGGRYLESDAVFGVRPSLIADWVRHETDDPARPPVYYTLDYDFVLNTTARSAD
ncbi:intradiol ring-cleavage dioxygenase [Variovorax fucosicus]|uniref:intradiol ring-cleavage dioxygenase n=1 Tax=Variovorax fucosicus TaxID=3053517 RepID=UPI00257498DD|nr:intradiol ring-cleavage dioxygenase [Variovorax sp. J22G47]MDM0059370.1 intradiol ring-cleavage dioxygenase [Variovorax sp. J22G47]